MARRADRARAVSADRALREGRPLAHARSPTLRSTSTSSAQRTSARMRELTDLKQKGNLVDTLLADHGLFHLEADLRWIDLTEARLAALAEEVAS